MKRSVLCCLCGVALIAPAVATENDQEECVGRLSAIAKGNLSGDDQMAIEQCLISGHVSSQQVAKAYGNARRSKK
jgi:hypothetical protein